MDFIPSPLRNCFSALLLSSILCIIPLSAQATPDFNKQVEEIRAHYATLLKARKELEQTQNQGELSQMEKSDYAGWIDSISERVSQDCNRLKQANYSDWPDDLPCEQIIAHSVGPAVIDLNAERSNAEQTNALIEAFDTTLGEFDERLLQEQARVKAQRPPTESGSGESADGPTESMGNGEQSNESATDGEQGRRQGEMQGAQNQAGNDNGTQSSTDQNKTPGKPTSGTGKGTAANVPDNIPDGQDDDVVARQLREAAEKEADPELREKLWEEYRRYKAGTG